MAVDIIIPVYNAYEQLSECLESIWKWTDFKNNRLILIDDNSPDERIKKLLDAQRQEHVIVIHNPQNRGFSANVNIGIAQSDTHNIIVLNSDTVVTKGWVEKLEECAYSDRAIATATPLSNNATLCSVPDFGKENTIPQGYSLDEYAELIERVSMKRYPRIPVANGFCMYIKREAIRKIGGFDAEAFGKGYGEENDFCFRAIEAGYYHAMCDDTFILHTGTQSFTSREKMQYIRAHEEILRQRYGSLVRAVQLHCRNQPNAAVSENIRFWTEFEKNRQCKTILYLLQSDFRPEADNHTGGTQLHVKDLMQGLRKSFFILVAARDASYLNLTLYTKKQEFLFRYYVGPQEEYERFRCGTSAAMYGTILEFFRVSCVHIHHTKGLTLELYYEAKKRGIPVLATLHDYFYVCPGMKLLNGENRLCIGRETEKTCRICAQRQFGIAKTVPYMQVWREECRNALQTAGILIVPSKSAKEIILGYYKELEPKIRVIGHGIPSFGTPKINHSKNRDSFHIAFLGGINMAKGFHHAKALIKSREKGIHWYLFGNFEEQDALQYQKSCFTDSGNYIREELPELLQKHSIDLVCILSVCPETYSYTLSEAVACGIPVLATDIGALGERVREMDCGWLVPQDASAEEILKVIRRLKPKGEAYQRKVQSVKKIRLRTLDEMCRIYQRLYEEEMAGMPQQEHRKQDNRTRQKLVYRQNVMYLNFDAQNLAEHLEEAEKQLHQVTGSYTYRAARLAAAYIPLKRQLAFLLRKGYHWIRRGIHL
ncbi:MAG: glycosyltransferase [Eubacterium sp.]|nr:glycosyltransferase [Eubacterium sp.]